MSTNIVLSSVWFIAFIAILIGIISFNHSMRRYREARKTVGNEFSGLEFAYPTT